MQWKFGEYLLDSARAELHGPEGPVAIEKTPLDLLFLLVRNPDRVVTRDEIVEDVWGGRIVSEATVSTAIKQARRAVGDSGAAQSVIRTVHGRGFRFVAAVETPAPPAAVPASKPAPGFPDARSLPGAGRPSLAVLRFQPIGAEEAGRAIADAFPAELITSLSRIGWLHVIARGSSFRFDPAVAAPDEIANALGVRYLIAGSIESVGEMLTISIELVSAADGRLIWSDRRAATRTEVQVARRDLAAEAIAALELHLPRFEAESASQLTPAQFDAWSHFHLGLRHLYRFNVGDSRIASEHFEAALALDPAFARAHAGLSFTAWQNAFMHFGEDRSAWLGRAEAAAARALALDDRDPFAAFNMGRAGWLRGDIDGGLAWFDRALAINPNFAQCHYTRGLSHLLRGDTAETLAASDRALALSPLDPLIYAMLSSRAMSHIAEENFDEARRLVDQAVHSPGAHFYISLIAAVTHELSGDRATADRWRDHALSLKPDASQAMFFQAFPFRDAGMRARMSGSFGRLGLG